MRPKSDCDQCATRSGPKKRDEALQSLRFRVPSVAVMKQNCLTETHRRQGRVGSGPRKSPSCHAGRRAFAA